MTAPMTMNRLIHAAVRRDLDRLDAALGQVSDGDRARAAELARAYANLRLELTHHHEGEDTHIWPMLERAGVSPELLRAMEAEHHAMADALAETSAAMTRFSDTASATDAAAARASVGRTRAVVDRHLAHEEDELEPALRPHLGTPEWKAVEKKLRAVSPGVGGRFFAWLTDGIPTTTGRSSARSSRPPWSRS
ncbi:hemerythrin domain-containing protein [Blastococcus sp. PRF04-17]|uniref:hemerythrin domain-containing protein n=1 Tax=Blastococcus sp. PRF04-17 TaxID=2933797 RepID=UPI001FF3D593|nr:hemerythrin domain-containing protein [Blastococcus sp. PRF04-17]UOY02156.1 hemerythrin domain-containing protein [Blastococcus sp. PRF04-17]